MDKIWKSPISGPITSLGSGDRIRLVTNDFMWTGGDGYTVFANGTNVLQPGDDLRAEDIAAHSPIGPVVEGRIIRP